jgi:dihydropteroate synthase
MGVVNVTPDSFSDGGRFFEAEIAVAHGLALAAAGAAMLDVGGESTRPGAEPVAAAEELRRVVPVVRALVAATDVPVSVDTTKAAVAAAALDAGAVVVNDVSAGLGDDRMLAVVAERDAGFIAMHMQGTPRTMQSHPAYDDVVVEVGAHLRARVAAAVAAGVARDAIIVDPGIGFGKTLDHNLALLRALPALAVASGVPLVVGASRKSFIGTVLGGLPVDERDEATLATSVWCFEHGVAMVRVHDVESSVRAAALMNVMERATPEGVIAA